MRSLLEVIGLDVAYEQAAGDLLSYRDDDGRDIEVLDLVGGYGTLLFGHNHPALVEQSVRFFTSQRPNHAQGSLRAGAESLARTLSARLGGDFHAIFANSGAEAVEAAMKHAVLETNGRTVIALEGAFHGKTSGALQLTANPSFREPFDRGGLRVIRVPPNDNEQLRTAFAQCHDAVGLILEPIQGEAGIRLLTEEFARLAAELCSQREIPLIADECQTGMGRTGDFLVSHALGISPDYVVLSKALGGGMAKISALLVKRQRYQPAFDLIHSSTFADDEYSCAIALKTLEMVDEAILRQCRSQGEYLTQQLQSLQRRFPMVIADVRGKGLLIGIELQRPTEQSAYWLKLLAQHNLLGPVICGYMLRERQVRVAPTLSDSFTLRVQPSALISCNQLDHFIAALTEVCEKIHHNDICGLTSFLTDSVLDNGARPNRLSKQTTPVMAFRSQEFWHREAASRRESPAKRRVAWIFHLIDQHDSVHLEPAFEELTSNARENLLQRFAHLAEPVAMGLVDIQSSTGESVLLCPLLLPVTSDWMLKSMRSHDGAARMLVQRAADAATSLGCDIVSLGQFTSTVTASGRRLKWGKAFISTGNNYTAALAAQSVRQALAARELDSRELTLAVVGAAGDIGHTCALMLSPQFRRSQLVGSGSPSSQARLHRMARRLGNMDIANDPSRIAHADVVICATNSTAAPIGPEHLKPNAIVCDVSVPATLQAHSAAMSPECTFLPGAVAQLPYGEDLSIPGFPLPRGYTYGCMAEGLLLGLEGVWPNTWRGRSTPQHAMQVAQIANRHGFKMASVDFSFRPSMPHAPCQR